jgi:hypothetical protein
MSLSSSLSSHYSQPDLTSLESCVRIAPGVQHTATQVDHRHSNVGRGLGRFYRARLQRTNALSNFILRAHHNWQSRREMCGKLTVSGRDCRSDSDT